MRLIDKAFENSDIDDLDRQPTVDAIPREWVQQYIDNIWAGVKEKYIPIEWIRNYIIKTDDVWHYDETREVLEEMLKDWEKENEENIHA